MRAKLSVLRASRLLLRPGGRTGFFTIHPAPGLGPGQRRRAHRDGPVAVASHVPSRQLLERAGFVDIEESDCTPEFAAVARAWIEQWDGHRDALAVLYGASEVDQRQRDRRTQLRAVEDGLLRRSLLIASRPMEPFDADRRRDDLTTLATESVRSRRRRAAPLALP
jgi:hypothetical protein